MKLTVVLFFIFLCIGGFAQQKLSEGEQEVNNKAYLFFDDDNYAEALPLFSRLLSLFPKDFEYNYAYGVCLVEENKDIDKAITYLNYVTKNIDKPGALYYIGKVWHMKYKFDEAIVFYNRFKEKAKKEDLKKFPADRQIRMCNSGKDLIRYVSILNVEVNKIVKSKDFYYSYEIDDFGGKILVKTPEEKTKIDKKKEKTSENKNLMFLSNDLGVVYFSSYGDNDKNGKDIYRKVKDNASGLWLPAENLGVVINTPYDEDYPYIHPDGQTLYFASKGHSSMGGYDIFKSTYDWATNTWSKPINLDFPTNSPYDDYLYISDAKESIAYFASNRETGQANVSVYRIKIDKNPQKKEIENFDEIIKKSKLEVSVSSLAMKNRDDDMKMDMKIETKSDGSNTSNVEKGKYTFPEISLSESTTAEEIFKEAESDAAKLTNEAKSAERDANVVLLISDKRNKEANEKRKEEESTRNAALKLQDKDAKEKEIAIADKLNEDADQKAKEAVLAYNLAMNFKNIAEDKNKDARESTDFSKELSFNKNKKLREIVESINANRKKINERQKNYTSIEKELFKSKISINEISQLLTNKTSDLDLIKTTLSELGIKIKVNNENILKEINTATKIKMENDVKGWENDISNKKRQEFQLNFEIPQLEARLKATNKDISFYQQLIDEISSNKEEYANAAQTVAKIDNTKLVKEINDKKVVVEKQMAELKIVEAKTNEQITSENKKIDKDKNLLVSNENYNQLITEAKISEHIADSLNTIIDKGRKDIEKIKDPKKKEDEQNRLNNLQTIAEFKKQDADKKYAQANEIGNTYISLNDVNAKQNIKENEVKTQDVKTENQTIVENQNKSEKQLSSEKQTTDNNAVKENEVKTEKQVVSEKQNTTEKQVATNTNSESGVLLKSVLAGNEQNKLRDENPAYSKVLNEATKALRMSDSLLIVAQTKKNNVAKLKTAQEKQNEQESITNVENIAAFKKQLAEKRFAEVNQFEKAYLTSQGKSTDVFAANQNSTSEKQISTEKQPSDKQNAGNTTNADSQLAAEKQANANKQIADKQTTDKQITTDNKLTTDTQVTTDKKTETIDAADKKVADKVAIEEIKKTVLVSKLESTDQKKLIASNENYKTLFTEANRSLEVADSLFKLADTKRAGLAKIKDKKKRDAEEEKTANMDNIALFKKQFAQKKYAQINEIEQEFIASKNIVENKEASAKTNETNINSAENKTPENKDNSAQIKTENEKINKDKEILQKNPDYTNIIAEAKAHEVRADSLNVVIAEKKKNVDKIKSKKNRQKEIDLIASLEISVKNEQLLADNSYAKANETSIKILAQNSAKTDNKQDVVTEKDNKQQTTADNVNADNNKQSANATETKIVADNTSNKTDANETKAAIILTDSEKSKLLNVEKYVKLVKEADKNKNISDSLLVVAETKKKGLPKIANAQEKQAEQDQITNIESIANFKKAFADKKYNEAADFGKSYLVANPGLPENNMNVAENKTENKNVVTENKSNVTENKTDVKDKTKVADNKSADNTVKENKNTKGKTPITNNKTDKTVKETKTTDGNNQTAANNKINKNDKKAENKVVKETLLVSHATYKSTLTDDDKTKLSNDDKFKKLSADAAKSQHVADSLYLLAETKKTGLAKIKNAQDKQAEEDKITNIESVATFKQKYADKKLAEVDEYAKSRLTTGNLADNKVQDTKESQSTKTDAETTNSNTNKTEVKSENKTEVKVETKTEVKSEKAVTDVKVTEQNKTIENNKQQLLNNDEYATLISEAKKAQGIADSLAYVVKERKNKLGSITDADKKIEEENAIAAIEKTLEFKRQYAEQKFAKANDLSVGMLANKNTASSTDSKVDILKSSPEEQDKYYKEQTALAKNMENETSGLFAESDKIMDKINAAYDPTEKQKFQQELAIAFDKIKTKLIEAYKIKSNADIVKNTMLEKKVAEMMNLPEIQNNKQIAVRYKKDADQFSSMAESARTLAVNSSDIDERMKELKKALGYEQLAMRSNETAIDVLLESTPVQFVSADIMIKSDENDPFNKLLAVEKNANTTTTSQVAAYDKKSVKDEVLNKLYTNKPNKENLDKLGDIKEVNDKNLAEVFILEEEIAALKDKSTLSANDEEKKSFETRIDEKVKKLNKKKYGIAASVQKEHEQLYEMYIKNVFAMRPTEASTLLTEGMKVETEASGNFKKANDFRKQAMVEKDKDAAVALHDKANALELLALEQQEKAFGIYLKLIPVTVKTEETKILAQNNKANENKIDENKDSVKIVSENKSEKKENVVDNKIENKHTDIKTEIKNDNEKKSTKTQIKSETENKTKVEEKVETTDAKKDQKVEIKKDVADNKKEIKNEIKTEAKVKKTKTEINTDNVKAENRLATKEDSNTQYGFNVTSKNNTEVAPTIVTNEAIPSGIVYRVQIGAFKVPIEASSFKGLSPLACERLAGSQYVKYLVGLFRSEEAAKIAREEVRKSGYKDAFIVAYKDGVRIPLYAARNTTKSADAANYSEMAKNEVETLNKNIKDAKKESATNNNVAENKTQTENNTENIKVEKKKNKKSIEEFKKENENQNKQIADNNQKIKDEAKAEAKKNNQTIVTAVNVKDIKGVLYTVQIGVFRNARTVGDLMNLSPIFEERMMLAGNEAIKYTTGIFADYIEAISAKEKIIALGIKDAYVVVYYNGKPMAVNQANVMVMNQGSSIIANAKDLNIKASTNADNIKVEKDKDKGKPVAIIFKVQIGSFKDQVPNDMVDKFIKVAANGGLGNFMDGDSKVYTIGDYKSYEEATNRKIKIADQGIPDAFVIAFRGTEKISVEQAKQLLLNK